MRSRRRSIDFLMNLVLPEDRDRDAFRDPRL
jgi:hypothetical protein